MVLDNNIYSEINEYCKENNLKTRDFIHKILKEAFLKEKYGDSPFAFIKETEKTNEVKENIINNEVDEPKKITKDDILIKNESSNIELKEEELQTPIKKKKRKL